VIALPWYTAKFGVDETAEASGAQKGSLDWALANLTCIKNAKGDKPIVLLIESREMQKRGSKSKATKQYLASFKVLQTVFYDAKHKGRVAGSMFKCLRMDVSNIKDSQSELICNKTAPIIAVYSKDRVLKYSFKGGSTSNSAVFSAMCEVMQKEGVDVNKMYRAMYGELDKLYKNEIRLYKYKKKLAEETAKCNKKKSTSAEKKVARAQKSHDDCKAVSDTIRAKCKEIMEAQSD
jgi:hypothetical protein